MTEREQDVAILFLPEGIRIPGNLTDLRAFRSWATSDEFPETGRIDWLGGQVEVDVSPEDLNTHGTPKAAIARDLGTFVEGRDLGVVLVERTRLSVDEADLSVEPDIVVVLFDSIDSGRVLLVPKSGGAEGRFVELQGPADIVCECISDSSEKKDRDRLFTRYHEAGVREYWLVDARRNPPSLAIHRHTPAGYVRARAGASGRSRSAVLGASVRLVRLPPRSGIVRYRLDIA